MSQASEKGRFVWHELMTSDTAAAQQFYKTVVGWGTAKYPGADNPDTGFDYTMWMAGETPVGGVMPITEDGKAMAAPPSWLAYTEVPNADETVEAVTRRGGSVILPAHSVAGVGRFALLRDPQGAVFAVLTSEMQLAPKPIPRL